MDGIEQFEMIQLTKQLFVGYFITKSNRKCKTDLDVDSHLKMCFKWYECLVLVVCFLNRKNFPFEFQLELSYVIQDVRISVIESL